MGGKEAFDARFEPGASRPEKSGLPEENPNDEKAGEKVAGHGRRPGLRNKSTNVGDGDRPVVVIGAGPAGLAAAAGASRWGAERVVLLERDRFLGGILNQCIHDGFGLVRYREQLTGPEYAERLIEEVRERAIEIRTAATMTGIDTDLTVTAVSPRGLERIRASAVVLATGCRERARGALCIPGPRPAGVFTAGAAQGLMNLSNVMIGKRVVILGSGDIGLIMARRLTLEGAEVAAVVEKQPYPGGLIRNVVQCLEDFGIPLYLSHTVTGIEGRGRLSAVRIARLDDEGKPVEDSELKLECDTLVLSVGLIPENSVAADTGVEIDPATGGPVVDDTLMTSIPGIFSCGNSLHVHDLADYASDEAERAGAAAAVWANRQREDSFGVEAAARVRMTDEISDNAGPAGAVGRNGKAIVVLPGPGVRYVVPRYIKGADGTLISLRVTRPVTGVRVVAVSDGTVLKTVRCDAVMPSEMLRFELPGRVLEGVKKIEISVEP